MTLSRRLKSATVALAATGGLAASMLAAQAPAQAQQLPGNQIQHETYPDACLAVDANGHPAPSECDPNDINQRWKIVDPVDDYGYWELENAATGQCLTYDDDHFDEDTGAVTTSVLMAECGVDNPYSQWSYSEFYSSHQFRTRIHIYGSSGQGCLALRSDLTELAANGCGDIAPNLNATWTVI